MHTKIFAGNLPDGTDIKQITDLFSVHGKVADANVIRNYAFVHFEDEREAKKAVEELNKSEFSGRTINVELSKNQKSDAKGRPERRSDGRRDDRRDDRRDRSQRSRSRDRSSRRNRSRARGGILPNPLGALAGLSGLGAFGAAPAFTPPIQPSVSRDPQHEKERPNPDVRVRREAVHVSHIPGAAAMGLMDGFVVYERYYVDPNHPLLKEPARPRVEDTPVCEEPRVYDSFVAPRQETYTAPSRQQEDSYVAPSRQQDSYPAPSRQQQDSYSAPSSRQQDSYSAPAPSRQQELVAYPGYGQQKSTNDPYAALSTQASTNNSYGRAAEDSKSGFNRGNQPYNPYASESY